MKIRKLKADRLFTGEDFAPDDFVLIADASGKILDLVPGDYAGEDIEQHDGILVPGWINAHCHLELSHMAGQIPEKTGMVPFLLAVMQHRVDRIARQEIAMQQADEAMYAEGIVAVGDICNSADTVGVKQNSRIRYHNFIETSGFVPAGAATRFAAAKNILGAFGGQSQTAIVPHAPYSVSPELFRMIFEEYTQLSTMHNQESEAENDFFREGNGPFRDLFAAIGVSLDFFQAPQQNSLPAVAPLLQAARQLILVHNTVTAPEDILALQEQAPQTALYWCLCPLANEYITGTLPPIDLFRNRQLNICLGTDSLASNYRLSIAETVGFLEQRFPQIPQPEILHWATLGGAKALQLEHAFGSFGKGKSPGIVCYQAGVSKRIL
ncbi:amidohydrolase family protein [Flavihumibacter petaseus]|uniref:Putative hydrolase n=1 Tax=Flavihumibacter petaseus NBRC 106054 TaxID=1220578 RepID=A0A0E9MWA9_9BACT|nr:amidohydrolase family protein [Flavihumibacter petaseus]GAO41803.1 putative hydrolase [Flavihumibacter petaseus NBRC 106054]